MFGGRRSSLSSAIRERLFARPRPARLSPEAVATALYRTLLRREPDPSGLADKLHQLAQGLSVEKLVLSFVGSEEFHRLVTNIVVPRAILPDLRDAMPEHYQRQIVAGMPRTIYLADTESRVSLMESLIARHRYYDAPGVWSAVIDTDKAITAAIVRGLGAASCFELGCYTGPVLSLLADAGIEVAGAEVSHAAFAFAYPNVRDKIVYGDLPDLKFDRRFDVILCMDVLEHVSPLKLDLYIERLGNLVEEDGFIYLNAPMWGSDAVFGTFEQPYLEEWRRIGDDDYWRHWPCDDQGWPLHGHLVWGSPAWWQRKFEAHGFVRDRVIEQAIHGRLVDFFAETVGRRSLFVLRRPTNAAGSAGLAAAVDRALAAALAGTAGAQSQG